MPKPTASILEHFQEVTDPGIEHQKLHQLLDIMVIAICAASFVGPTPGWMWNCVGRANLPG
jgi:hypothetical protein